MTAGERIAVVAPAVTDALAGQTRAPDEVVTGGGGLRRAHALGVRWIWLLDDGGAPRPDALERLIRARTPPGAGAGTIVAGAVTDAAGRVSATDLPGFRIERPDVIDLAGRGLLPIRHTGFAHCLIDAEAFTLHGFPDVARFGRYAAVEWSARVLRVGDGYFDPGSLVEAGGPSARPGLRDVPALARMLRSGAWSRGDRVAEITRVLRRD